LKIDDKAPAAVAAAGGEVKDAHWEDVQQKFDLARAYQEMGDKEGAKEILQEGHARRQRSAKADAEKMITSPQLTCFTPTRPRRSILPRSLFFEDPFRDENRTWR
jgi:FimV-like protein